MKKIVLPLIILAVLLIYFLTGKGHSTREIESTFIKMFDAGKKKDFDSVLEHFSITYKDDYGGTYLIVKNILKRFFDKFDSFDISFSDLKASFKENEQGDSIAYVNFDIFISGIGSGLPVPILGTETNTENLTITMKKSTFGKWKIIKVEGLESEEYDF